MNEKLYLHVPDTDEMWYRRRILMDADTMSFNKGNENADAETGCINFPQSQWQEFCDRFVDNEPDRFFAYIARRADLEFMGQVCLNREEGGMDLSILVENQYRAQGYAAEAMELLLQVAFEVCNSDEVHSVFETGRAAAVKLYEKAGFKAHEEGNMVRMTMTRAEYGYNPQPSDF